MNVEIDYLDDQITVPEEEPGTLAELVALYGEEAVRSYAADNWRYRNKHPRVYRKASKELETLSAKEVTTEKKLSDGTVKKVYESDINHLRRCYKVDAQKTTEAVTRIAQSELLFVKGERDGGGGKISQKAMDTANSMFAEGDDKVEAVVVVIEQTMTGYKVGRDSEQNVTPESLARGLQILNKFLTKQTEQRMLGMTGGKV